VSAVGANQQELNVAAAHAIANGGDLLASAHPSKLGQAKEPGWRLRRTRR